jgi:aminoglycoside phosphotransferase (APT) family kinase protein
MSLEMKNELRLRKELGLDNLATGEPWTSYYQRVVYNGHFSNPVQDKIAQKCYIEWASICNFAPTVVVLDDLHTENMLFNDDNQLIGVLDFGDTNVGTPEQELRQLYRINETVMLAAAQEYQRLSGRRLNLKAIKLWAIMKELADYSKRLAAKDTNHHSFKRANRNLNTWLPKGEWGKGYDLSNIEGYQ